MNMLPVDKSIPELLVEQARIKSRNRPIRDKSGQFIRPSRAIEIQLAKERMKPRLERDVEAAEHAAGYAYVHAHKRPLAGARLHSIESIPHTGERSDPLPSLFDARRVA